MDLTNDDVLKILKIIDESGYDDVRLEFGDFKLHVQKERSAGPAPGQLPAADWEVRHAPAAEPVRTGEAPGNLAAGVPETVPEGYTAVRAPMLGTFYRAPNPREQPFVQVGDKVGATDTVCLVEVMKLFSSIKAGVSGTVKKILVENGTLVEHGQLLLLIEPDIGAA